MSIQNTRKIKLSLIGRHLLVAILLLFCIPLFAEELDDASKAYSAGEFEEAASLLRPLVQDGIAEAQYLLGRMYEQGDGVEKDLGEAQRLYRLAAKQSHTKAADRLSQFEKGASNEESVVVGWYLPAAKEGDSEAQYNLGYLFETGLGVKVNEKDAASWYERAAELQHDGAQLRLGMMYVAGANGEKDLARGKELLRSSAKNGNRIAETLVQELFDVNDISADKAEKIVRGIRRVSEDDENKLLAVLQTSIDRARSSTRTRRPATEESSRQSDRGRKRDVAEPVVETQQQAQTSREPAASQTVERAQEALGKAVELGVVGGKSALEVVRRYQESAGKGNADAQVSLGVLYIQGKGVPKDEKEGLRWITQAAEQGHQQALSYLNLWKEDLATVTLRNTIALSWLIESARQWDLDALYALGFLYETGRGVAPSAKDALKWYRLAASQGHMEARARMSMLQQGGAPVAEALGSSEGASSSTTSLGVGPMIGVAVVVLLIIAIWKQSLPINLSFLKSRLSIPNITRSTSSSVATNGKLESDDLDFLKELWANKAATEQEAPAARPAPSVPEPRPVVAAEKPAPARERPVAKEPKISDDSGLDKQEIARQVEEKLAQLANTPAHEERAEKLRQEQEAQSSAHDVTPPRETPPRTVPAQPLADAVAYTAKEIVEPPLSDKPPPPTPKKKGGLSADVFSDSGISRDSLAISKISAENLFGKPFPIDSHGKVIKRVERAQEKLQAENFMEEMGSGFGEPRNKQPRVAPKTKAQDVLPGEPLLPEKFTLDILEHNKNIVDEQERLVPELEQEGDVDAPGEDTLEESALADAGDDLSSGSMASDIAGNEQDDAQETSLPDVTTLDFTYSPDMVDSSPLTLHEEDIAPTGAQVFSEYPVFAPDEYEETPALTSSDDDALSTLVNAAAEYVAPESEPEPEAVPEALAPEDLTVEEERSLAEVHYNIGVMFASGDGVPQNDVLAAKWFEKAANEGLAEAQYGLAELYLHGRGVAKNTSIALEWLEKASANGYMPAQELLNKKNKAI